MIRVCWNFCDIHTRARTKRLLKAAGAEKVFGLDEIMTEPVDGSGWNARYGLLVSNKATEDIQSAAILFLYVRDVICRCES